MEHHLTHGIVRFWAGRAIDHRYGGYLTSYDADGRPSAGSPGKHIVTQTRMIWCYASLHGAYPGDTAFRPAFEQGLDFFIRKFWDDAHGGWRWRVQRDGAPVDDAKLTYGQSFALYALADAHLATGDRRALDYALRTFSSLELHAADHLRGGWYENLEADWLLSAPGFAGGDRKSLDIHMHLMEAFTSLHLAAPSPTHARRLDEVIELILARMISPISGAGCNQLTLGFEPLPAIPIHRTWNADRGAPTLPADTTSYGHNLELAWLLVRADVALGRHPGHHESAVRRLVDHALRFGVDWEYGGIFRDGPHNGLATVCDKEFWQNAEALPGLLHAYEVMGDARCVHAFFDVWRFAQNHIISPLGEWSVLVSRTGQVLDGTLGNSWKAFYHTGRAMLESMVVLNRLLN